MPGHLINIVGLPGSGKTTLAKRLVEQLGGFRFPTDEWLASLDHDLWDGDFRRALEQVQWSTSKRLLQLGQTVVIEWGTWAREERDTLLADARALGATSELHVLDLPLDELWQRIERRNADPMWAPQPMSRFHLDFWADTIEWPDADEVARWDAPAVASDGVPGAGRVILLCGLPGSGKTTEGRRLEASLGAMRQCPDEWMLDLGVDLWETDGLRSRIHELQWPLAQQWAAAGLTVVIEWGVWSRAERNEVRSWCRDNAIAVELRFLDLPLDELERRLVLRNRQPEWQERPITRADLDEWATRFEKPDAEEFALFDAPIS